MGGHSERLMESGDGRSRLLGVDADGEALRRARVRLARFGDRIVTGSKLDLWTAAEQAALDAGAESVERVDLCTRCRADLFFSERRTGRPRGTQGVLGVVR